MCVLPSRQLSLFRRRRRAEHLLVDIFDKVLRIGIAQFDLGLVDIFGSFRREIFERVLYLTRLASASARQNRRIANIHFPTNNHIGYIPYFWSMEKMEYNQSASPRSSPLSDDADARLPAAAFLRYESRADGWNAGRQAAFLSHLADHGVVEDAARCVGKHVSGGYALRREARGYAFNLGWEAALIIARRIVADNLMAAAIRGEESRWVREDNVTTYTRQNTKLSIALLDRVNPATTLPEVMAVATRFDWFLQLLGDGVAAEELWELFFDDALPHSEMEARERVRVALLLTEESADFEAGDDQSDEPPTEYKSMDGPPRTRGDDAELLDGHQLARERDNELCCVRPIGGQPRGVVGLGEDDRHSLGMERCDQRVGLAGQESEDLGRIWRIACPGQIECRLFGQLGPAPHARKRRHRTVLYREPMLFPARPDLRLGKSGEGDEAALLWLGQHRTPEWAGQIADIGDMLGHGRPRPLSGQ